MERELPLPPGRAKYARLCREILAGVMAKMAKTRTWQTMMEKYRWGDTFMIEGLGSYLDSRQAVVTEIVNRLGMGKVK
jgi:hypothetical protein